MNTIIEIIDNNTEETGSYKVFYKDVDKKQSVKILSESAVNSLLTMRQKEDFFMGKHRFKINEYDFQKQFLDL